MPLCIIFLASGLLVYSQGSWSLTDLSAFESPGASWKLAGDVKGSFTAQSILSLSPGTGVLVNLSDPDHRGQDLFSVLKHGDLDLELDYMLPPGSNSGIYLQGRYEIQLLDSWGVLRATAGDNGGVYERWNDSKPEGQKGYEGHAPRQNASRAPGLWQHIRISFQAPRFDATGRKIENARVLRVELNGVLIQENVELSGPTRGAMGTDEVASGPLRFQGDHGSVAFRNINITSYDRPRPVFNQLHYAIYKGSFDDESKYKTLTPEAEGSQTIFSANFNIAPKQFLMRYTGIVQIKEAGEYRFNLGIAGGRGILVINNQEAARAGQANGWGTGKVSLAAGTFPVELIYTKLVEWDKPNISLSVGGPGIREFIVSDVNAGDDDASPIPINPAENSVLRSFSDIGNARVTHAVNVGSVEQVHYTYDMDKAMIVQVWRGGFIDAAPMWRGRGDGSARPMGMTLQFGKPLPAVAVLSSPDAAWSGDTTGSGYRPKGYIMDEHDMPTFRYQIYHTSVTDRTRVLPQRQGIRRDLTLQDPIPGLYIRLAEASTIEKVSEGLYLMSDRSYYLRIDDAGNAKPLIRDANGHKEIIIPIQHSISYSILF